jgi:hypothetical protein
MMPNDVAADASWLLRFQKEVAYLDRIQPSDEEVRDDAEVLGSKAGVLVIAWLWPDLLYDPSLDPFDAVAAMDQRFWDHATKDSPVADAAETLKLASRAVDRRRQHRRRVAARRFERIIETTARKLGHDDAERLKTHLKWSAPITHGELDRLLRAQTPFPFGVIVGLCSALQLEFTDAWVLVDPQRLARRIEQSVRASAIAERLDHLTLDNLANVYRRLPRPTDAGRLQGHNAYRAPAPGARYSSLYEALAADGSDEPTYTLTQIDQRLQDGAEEPLPDSARKRSWWAGSGEKTEGRPQVSAWWGAGYRVRNLEVDDSSGDVVSIGFEALPGRDEWRADPKRASRREYPAPDPGKVSVYPDIEGLAGALTVFAERIKPLAGLVDVERMRAGLSTPLDDPDVRSLTEFLDEVGEADRSQIECHFSRVRDEPFDASWVTNLLTRARRQGWTVNKGTRKHPSWATTRKRAMLIDTIAEKYNLEAPIVDPADPVPVEFLRRVATASGTPSTSTSAAQIAREIVESRGGIWRPEFESADKSITSLGLEAIDDVIGPNWVWRPEWDSL